jgi:hypothetical protein
MPKPGRLFFTVLLLCLGVAACATTLPPTYDLADSTDVLSGRVLAVAAADNVVVAATSKGLFQKRGDSWESLAATGIRNAGSVTAIALADGDLFVGTRDQGLHIFSEGAWTSRSVMSGDLPDDHITAIAVESATSAGLPGDNVWVGTRNGLAVRSDGQWNSYKPGERWLADLTGSGAGKGQVYMTSGFRYGSRLDEGRAFSSRIAAIGVGRDRVVLGSGSGRLAVLKEGAFATLKFQNGADVTSLFLDEYAIWCGTNDGLFWGGLHGETVGRPYPFWRSGEGASGTLFGIRDSRPLHYNWYRFGYNTALVEAILRDSSGGLWALFNEKGAKNPVPAGSRYDSNSQEAEGQPSSGVRRYVNVDEYIRNSSNPYYEVYGRNFGLKGRPSAASYDTASGMVWLGTGSELVGLKATD